MLPRGGGGGGGVDAHIKVTRMLVVRFLSVTMSRIKSQYIYAYKSVA